MKIFAVVIQRGEAKWIDSQWISENSAQERAEILKASYNSTNTTTTALGTKVIPFVLEDAKVVDEGVIQ